MTVTELLALTVIAQVVVFPPQLPPHPEKLNPFDGVAVRVTWVPESKLAAQVCGQLRPAGELVTVPVPASLTVSWTSCGGGGIAANEAVTELFPLMPTVQVVVAPVQLPAHPAKEEPVAAVAVRVTWAPEVKFAVHVCGQLMPVGTLVTVPDPTPASATVNGN